MMMMMMMTIMMMMLLMMMMLFLVARGMRAWSGLTLNAARLDREGGSRAPEKHISN